jgi:hypothetical protein
LKTRQPRQGSRVTILPTVKIVKGSPLRRHRDDRFSRPQAGKSCVRSSRSLHAVRPAQPIAEASSIPSVLG